MRSIGAKVFFAIVYLLALSQCAVYLLHGQQPIPLQYTRIDNISATAQVIDNRSQNTRLNDYHGFCVTGFSPTYSAQIQFSDTSSSGPWTNFSETTSLVQNGGPSCFGFATGYHPFLRFDITGNVSISYTGTRGFTFPYGGGTLTTIAAQNVTYTSTASGAVARNVRAKLDEVLSPRDFGAVCDAVTDDTAAIQDAIDALPVYGVLDGFGCHAAITTINVKSYMTLRNFKLDVLAAGAVTFRTAILANGLQNPSGSRPAGVELFEIRIENVHIDGKRSLTTNLVTPSEEDGGNHCIAIFGWVTDVEIRNSSGQYCGTDGLLVSGKEQARTTPVSTCPSDEPVCLGIQRVHIYNSNFSFNRRHGLTFNGVNDMNLVSSYLSNNARTLDGETVNTNGNHCATLGAPDFRCYGTGFWFENDGTASGGGSFNNINIIGSTIRDNEARSIYLFSNGAPNGAQFRCRSNLRVTDSWLDRGRTLGFVNPSALAVQLLVNPPNDGLGDVFCNIEFTNTYIGGRIALRQTNGFKVFGGEISTAGVEMGFREFSTNIYLNNVRLTPAGQTFPTSGNQTPNGSTPAIYTESIEKSWRQQSVNHFDVPLGSSFSYFPSDTFIDPAITSGTTTMQSYGIRWGEVTGFGGGPVTLISGFGGIRFYTQSTPAGAVRFQSGMITPRIEAPTLRIDSPLGVPQSNQVCSSLHEGLLWFNKRNGASVSSMWACGSDGAGNFTWKQIINWP